MKCQSWIKKGKFGSGRALVGSLDPRTPELKNGYVGGVFEGDPLKAVAQHATVWMTRQGVAIIGPAIGTPHSLLMLEDLANV